MEQHQAEILDKDLDRYKRLDKYLLYLLAGELGYFILLIIVIMVVSVLVFFFDVSPNFSLTRLINMLPLLIYILAFPLNMAGGMASIILNIKTKHDGYPGTGHLLNWIFLMTTGWLFIAAFVFMMPSLAWGGFD